MKAKIILKLKNKKQCFIELIAIIRMIKTNFYTNNIKCVIV